MCTSVLLVRSVRTEQSSTDLPWTSFSVPHAPPHTFSAKIRIRRRPCWFSRARNDRRLTLIDHFPRSKHSYYFRETVTIRRANTIKLPYCTLTSGTVYSLQYSKSHSTHKSQIRVLVLQRQMTIQIFEFDTSPFTKNKNIFSRIYISQVIGDTRNKQIQRIWNASMRLDFKSIN